MIACIYLTYALYARNLADIQRYVRLIVIPHAFVVARREIAVAINDAVWLLEQGCGFFFGQVKVHDRQMGLLLGGEPRH
jgi:hypothetical protein